MGSSRPKIGLVLSGGGMRGAYEAGVLAGILDVLAPAPSDPAPFQIFAGTSVGAINAAYLAAHADRGTMGIDRLVELWCRIRIEDYLKLDTLRALLPGTPFGRGAKRYHGRSLLDPRPFEALIRDSISWHRLARNVEEERVHAIIVAALDVADGHTALFGHFAPSAEFQPAPLPRREVVRGPISPDHVMASFAIPLLFPARRIGQRYFCEGGMRFNTPLAPAIRAGADRIVVISLLRRATHGGEGLHGVEQYPSPFFLGGKVLNALLLDPVVHDLQVLGRFNNLMEILERALPAQTLEEIQTMLRAARGAGYRKLETLSFEPSFDIGRLAGEHLHQHLGRWKISAPLRWFMHQSANANTAREADLASYILFDGAFAERLIDLGRRDAHARAPEIERFFAH